MKSIICFILSILTFSVVEAQPKVSEVSASIPTITINARLIGTDSVVIPFNTRYWIVQDDCAQIIRHAHYDFKNKYFTGNFIDVRKNDSTKIVAEGGYSKDGLKTGQFIVYYMNGTLKYRGAYDEDKCTGKWEMYYPNGILKAKGDFKGGKYIGNWDFYYNNGKPQLSFMVKNGMCVIENAWQADGIKTVINGNGYYQSDIDSSNYEWAGKLVNGLPDSAWDFRSRINTQEIAVDEYFNEGQFVRGTSIFNGLKFNYSDATHIALFPLTPRLYDLDNAGNLVIEQTCNGPEHDDVYIKIWGKTTYRKTMHMPMSGSVSVYKN